MDNESSNITYFDSSFLLNSITTPENKYAPRIQRKRNLYKGTQRVKRVRAALWTRSNGRGSSPFASFNPLSVVWKNCDDEGLRLVANRRGWNGTDTSRNVRPPTHPPSTALLLPDERRGLARLVTSRLGLTSSPLRRHNPLQLLVAIRDVTNVRSAANFCSKRRAPFSMWNGMVKWIMDFHGCGDNCFFGHDFL